MYAEPIARQLLHQLEPVLDVVSPNMIIYPDSSAAKKFAEAVGRKLRLQAQSQSVQIELAAQSVDQQQSKLAMLMAQVSFLLREYARSVTLISQNPEFSGSLVTAHDPVIQQAGDAFVLAQQWAFLTVQSFNYEDNCPEVTASNFLQRMLAARKTSDLSPVLDEMQSAQGLIASGCQSSRFHGTNVFSLRNDFFQANYMEGTNESFEPVLQGGLVATNAGASFAAWTFLLQQNVTTNAANGSRELLLQFSTTLDSQFEGFQRNPLFLSSIFGETIYYGPFPDGTFLHGTQVNVQTDGTTLASFSVELEQRGPSAIRTRGFCDNPSGSSAGFRYYNFGDYPTTVNASVNGFVDTYGSDALHDRSPANGQWFLRISEVNPGTLHSVGWEG